MLPASPPPALAVSRRRFVGIGLAAAVLPVTARAATDLGFGELYGKVSVLGLEFSPRVVELEGSDVRIVGFMAPPLKAEADFFVLGKQPMAICPFCSSDADWPDDIVVVYLRQKQTFEHTPGAVAVVGVLEHGSWTDPETGFVSLLRLRDADFRAV